MAFKICLAKLPLPAGEGWGEGERITHFLA